MNDLKQKRFASEHPTEVFYTDTLIDYEVRAEDTACINESELQHPWWYNIKYLFAGILFGIVLVKSQVISWFRIQEMFRLQVFTCMV
jgi:hypothetical protein